jgi:hypothetical protein
LHEFNCGARPIFWAKNCARSGSPEQEQSERARSFLPVPLLPVLSSSPGIDQWKTIIVRYLISVLRFSEHHLTTESMGKEQVHRKMIASVNKFVFYFDLSTSKQSHLPVFQTFIERYGAVLVFIMIALRLICVLFPFLLPAFSVETFDILGQKRNTFGH